MIVEDLAMVLALVLLPALAAASAETPVTQCTARKAGLVSELLALPYPEGRGVHRDRDVCRASRPSVAATAGGPHRFARTLHTGRLAVALGIAFGSAKFFGVSFALGAFFAGMVLHESDLSHKAATNVLPLQDAFAVFFFASVGMLFDPTSFREPLMVAGDLLVVLWANRSWPWHRLAMGYPLSTALTVSASFAQIGEFSFILAGLGVSRSPHLRGIDLVLAGALISITLNPFVFAGADRVMARSFKARPALKRRFEESRGKRIAQGSRLGELARGPAEIGWSRKRRRTRRSRRKNSSPGSRCSPDSRRSSAKSSSFTFARPRQTPASESFARETRPISCTSSRPAKWKFPSVAAGSNSGRAITLAKWRLLAGSRVPPT